MNTKLNELTNVELYDELVPIVKQLCENFFYRDIKEYYLPIECSDLFFKLYDIVLDYEYSKTPNLYKSSAVNFIFSAASLHLKASFHKMLA